MLRGNAHVCMMCVSVVDVLDGTCDAVPDAVAQLFKPRCPRQYAQHTIRHSPTAAQLHQKVASDVLWMYTLRVCRWKWLRAMAAGVQERAPPLVSVELLHRPTAAPTHQLRDHDRRPTRCSCSAEMHTCV